LKPHDPNTFTVFFDRRSCEELEKSIREAKRKFWAKMKKWRCLNPDHGKTGLVFRSTEAKCPDCPICGTQWPVIPANAKIDKIQFGVKRKHKH
jgi:hypothetical protein